MKDQIITSLKALRSSYVSSNARNAQVGKSARSNLFRLLTEAREEHSEFSLPTVEIGDEKMTGADFIAICDQALALLGADTAPKVAAW